VSAAPVVLVRVARLYIAYQKFQFGYILEGLVIENVIEIEYITAIGYVLCTFGHFVVIWYIIPRFGTLYQENSGNPGCFNPFRRKLGFVEKGSNESEHP
jgi:hypothetical protein